MPQRVAKRPILPCEMGRFATQFGPFRKVKWAVLQIGMGTGAAEGGIFYRTDIWRCRRKWLPLPTSGTCRRESAWIVVPRKQYQWQVSYLANGADCSSAQNCQTLRSPYKQGRNADYGSMLVGAYHVLMSRKVNKTLTQ